MLSKIDLIQEPHLPQQHKAPQRIDDGPGIPFTPSTPEEFYSIKYFALMNSVMMGLTERFKLGKSSRILLKLRIFSLEKEKDVDDIVQHYGDDIDGPRLKEIYSSTELQQRTKCLKIFSRLLHFYLRKLPSEASSQKRVSWLELL